MSACVTNSELPPELAGLRLERTGRHVRLELPAPWRACGWAPLGGGLTRARQLFILRVTEQNGRSPAAYPPPETTLARYQRARHWPGPATGLMTAASTDSCRLAWRHRDGIALAVVVTAGLANARRAGDRADWQPETGSGAPPPGTINILAATNAGLTDAAMLEALMIATEAKAAVLTANGVKSPISGLPATGTGTDCAVVACGDGPVVRWCGKHVVFGEMLAGAVMAALGAAIAWDLAQGRRKGMQGGEA